MKKTLLILFLSSTISLSAQGFGTGNVQFNSNFSASVSINGQTNITTLTMVVPSNVWFAVGFGGSTMSSGADVFRSNGTDITDAKSTGTALPGADSQQDWTLSSNTVSGNTRTMVVTRANNTGDSDDFVFNPSIGSLMLMWAHGSSSSYSYHGGSRGAIAVSVLSTNDVESLNFEIYPNPATTDLTLKIPQINNSSIEFFDYTGRTVLFQNINSTTEKININSLSTGIYILKIISDGKVGIQKFIKR